MPTTEVLHSRREVAQRKAQRRRYNALVRRSHNFILGEGDPAQNIPERFNYLAGCGQKGDQDLVLWTPEGIR